MLQKYLLPITVLLAIPAVPFLLYGDFFETELPHAMREWLRGEPDSVSVAVAVVGLLSVDVFLPVPSSVVCSLAGSFLGVGRGIFYGTLGLSAGALLGFGLGRMLARPVMRRWIGDGEWRKLNDLVDRHGIYALVLLRPVPLFAEASTLLLGCSRMHTGVFFWATLPIHVLMVSVYVFLGNFLGVTVGVALSVLIALALSVVAKKLLPS